MTSTEHGVFARSWKDIASAFLRLGATSYGGPAIMGIMQAELQEKRQWVSRERFVEGLSLVNMLPGATATQLGIFLGYTRGGWWGGLLGGLCFVLPAFFVMLALTIAYASLGVTPILRGALYGLGPVVLGVFVVAVCRLGRSAVSTVSQALIAVAAAAAIGSPLGIAAILVLSGGAGLLLFHSRRPGVIVVVASAAVVAVLPVIAFIQQQVVEQFHWLTPREFIDGLALGQFTPGPILMVAAYVGYKVAGVAGAAVAAAAAFLPSFILMLAVLPVLERVRKLAWTRAVMKGMGPAVIGVLGVSLFGIAPHALPDLFAVAMLVATVIVLSVARIGAVRLMIAGSVLGVLRSRVWASV